PTPTTPAPATPTTPANLTGTATTTSIKLSWNAADNAESYELKRDGQEVYSGNELTYTDTGLKESTSYTYTLVAKNGTGESSAAWLQVKTADPTPTDPTPTTPAPATPATPANLTGTATTTSIKLSWNAADNTESYELKRDGQEVYSGNELTYTDTGLKESTSYTYTLVAKNGTGESSAAWLQVKTADPASTTPQTTPPPSIPVTPPPTVPINFVGTSNERSILLIWDPVAQAVSYELKRDGVIIYSGVIYQGKLTWFTDRPLTPSKKYTYTLVAKNNTGESTPEAIQITTKSYNVPVLESPKFVKKLVRSTTTTLTWKKVINADTYELLRDGKSIYKGKLTWFTDKRLTPSKKYTYTLVAWSRNDSSQSSVILVTNPNSPDKIKTKTSLLQRLR
ncbi:fibronectin type III domain-containing protein, partial [Paenibacillus sp. NPDC055715]